MFDVQYAWDYVIAILLAVAGGLARLLSGKDRTRAKAYRILSELFVSGFTGLMTLFLARSFGFSGEWLGLVCGLSGWIRPRILDLLAQPVIKKMGLEIKNSSSIDSEQKNKNDGGKRQ